MLKPGFYDGKIKSATIKDGKIQIAVTVNDMVDFGFSVKINSVDSLAAKQVLKASIAKRIIKELYGYCDNMDELDLVEAFDLWGISGAAVRLYYAKKLGIMK